MFGQCLRRVARGANQLRAQLLLFTTINLPLLDSIDAQIEENLNGTKISTQYKNHARNCIYNAEIMWNSCLKSKNNYYLQFIEEFCQRALSLCNQKPLFKAHYFLLLSLITQEGGCEDEEKSERLLSAIDRHSTILMDNQYTAGFYFKSYHCSRRAIIRENIKATPYVILDVEYEEVANHLIQNIKTVAQAEYKKEAQIIHQQARQYLLKAIRNEIETKTFDDSVDYIWDQFIDCEIKFNIKSNLFKKDSKALTPSLTPSSTFFELARSAHELGDKSLSLEYLQIATWLRLRQLSREPAPEIAKSDSILQRYQLFEKELHQPVEVKCAPQLPELPITPTTLPKPKLTPEEKQRNRAARRAKAQQELKEQIEAFEIERKKQEEQAREKAIMKALEKECKQSAELLAEAKREAELLRLKANLIKEEAASEKKAGEKVRQEVEAIKAQAVLCGAEAKRAGEEAAMLKLAAKKAGEELAALKSQSNAMKLKIQIAQQEAADAKISAEKARVIASEARIAADKAKQAVGFFKPEPVSATPTTVTEPRIQTIALKPEFKTSADGNTTNALCLFKQLKSRLIQEGAKEVYLTGSTARCVYLNKEVMQLKRNSKGELYYSIDLDIVANINDLQIRNALPDKSVDPSPPLPYGRGIVFNISPAMELKAADNIPVMVNIQIFRSSAFVNFSYPYNFQMDSLDRISLHGAVYTDGDTIFLPLEGTREALDNGEVILINDPHISYAEDARRFLKAARDSVYEMKLTPSFLASVRIGLHHLSQYKDPQQLRLTNQFLADKVFSYADGKTLQIFNLFVQLKIIDVLFPNLWSTESMREEMTKAILMNHTIEDIYIHLFFIKYRHVFLKFSTGSQLFDTQFFDKFSEDLLNENENALFKICFEDFNNKPAGPHRSLQDSIIEKLKGIYRSAFYDTHVSSKKKSLALPISEDGEPISYAGAGPGAPTLEPAATAGRAFGC